MFRWPLYKSVKSARGSCKILKEFSDSEFVKSVTSNNGGYPPEVHYRISWAEPFAPYRALVASPKASKCIFLTRFGRPHRTHLRISGTADLSVRAFGGEAQMRSVCRTYANCVANANAFGVVDRRVQRQPLSGSENHHRAPSLRLHIGLVGLRPRLPKTAFGQCDGMRGRVFTPQDTPTSAISVIFFRDSGLFLS